MLDEFHFVNIYSDQLTKYVNFFCPFSFGFHVSFRLDECVLSNFRLLLCG